MKKIVLSLAGVLAAVAFAPEAAAVPGFARQTGMACSACHFQHFPVLNSFGMAFKASGYTMMGAQGKVEGDHLSIPNTLNSSALVKLRYQKTNGVDNATQAAVNGTTTNSGQWQVPDEMAMFIGGRLSDNVGAHAEVNLAGTATNGGIATGFKLPMMFDVGGAKVGMVPFWTDVLGMAHGFELSSSAMVRGLRWAEDRATISAASFVGMNSGGATGIAFVAKNDMGYINLTRYSPVDTSATGGGVNAGARQFKSNWLRIAATPTYADWNMHIALGLASGANYDAAAVVQTERKASILDFQGQTQLAGKDFSLYASYARAPGGPTAAAIAAGAIANPWNANPNAKKAYQIGADYSVIPHVLHIGASYLNGDSGALLNNKDNGYMIQAIYDYAQNIALHASYRKNSGSVYGVGGAKNTAVAAAAGKAPRAGDSLINLMLEASF